MTDGPRLVSAKVYLAWWEAISERLAQNPTDKGTSIWLWQLDAIGRSNDATRLIAMRNEQSTSTWKYVLASFPDEQFDWETGVIDFARTGQVRNVTAYARYWVRRMVNPIINREIKHRRNRDRREVV